MLSRMDEDRLSLEDAQNPRFTPPATAAVPLDRASGDFPSFTVVGEATFAAVTEPVDPSTSAASEPFIGKWNRLVSRTNWEKGAIISQWRESLEQANLPVAQYADETWAQLVGGVTGQHVGRLRRVYQRFHATFEQYHGLFWSHFQAALDWSDAEMWLEGAVRSKWSVSEMRRTRWESLGAIPSEQPAEKEIVATETDEDYAPVRTSFDEATAGPLPEGPDFGDEPTASSASRAPSSDDESTPSMEAFVSATEQVEAVRPFENLPELPDDVAEAFEQFKLAILHHKATGWEKISCEQLLASLDALKILAQTATAAPF
jgi:hypothetical protein